MNDQVQSLIRAVLKIGGGYLVSKGIADSSNMEIISAGIVAATAVVWGYFHRTPKVQ